jgi:hypothetical protein
MFRNPQAMEMARDEGAWTDTGKARIKEDQAAAFKEARGHIDADRQAYQMLDELEESLKRMPETGVLSGGPTLQARNHIVSLYNDIARITAPLFSKEGQPGLPQVQPNTVAAVEQVNKLANTLAFALARTLGSREAVQIVTQARNSVPSGDVSPQGARYILHNLRAGIEADRDYYNGLQNWSSSNITYGNSIKGYDDWFAQTHPAQIYSMKAAALAARGQDGQPLEGKHFQSLLRHPDQANTFDQYWGTPGLGRYYLSRQGAGGP